MKKEITAFLHRSKESYESEYRYSIYTSDMGEYGYTLLTEKKVSFELPNENLMLIKEIDMLNRKAQKIKADAFVAVEKIEEKTELVCLSNIPCKSRDLWQTTSKAIRSRFQSRGS